MILKVMLRHGMRAERGVIFVGFADYSGFVVEAHLQITLNLKPLRVLLWQQQQKADRG